MDSIVCVVCSADEILRVGKKFCRVCDVVRGNGVHVMNIHSSVDSIAVYAEVAAQIPSDHIVPNSLPLVGMVESLVQVAVEAECVFAHTPVQFQILKPLKESR